MTTDTPRRADPDVVLVAPMARLVNATRRKHAGAAATARLVVVGIVGVAVATGAALAAAITPLLLVGATAAELQAHFAVLTPRPRLSVLIACLILAVPVVLAFAIGWTASNRVHARVDAERADAPPAL